MFYCDPCGEEHGYPTDTFVRSRGPCEICGTNTVNNDVPSRALPRSKLAPPEEEIACVANRYKDIGVLALPVPARHHHVMWTYLMIYGKHDNSCEQGFLTTKGRFVDRVEGLRIAKEADQIETKHGNPDMLFSEDMWDTPPEARNWTVHEIGKDCNHGKG